MAFCPNCGTQVSGTFCPNCGTQVNAPGATGAGPVYEAPRAIHLNAGGLTDNVASALCYLGWFVTGIIFLVLAPYNRNKTVRFHAFQAIFLTVGVIICRIILGIILGLAFAGGLWYGAFIIYRLFDLAVLLLWVYMMYTAYNNRRVQLPLVGDLAQKQA